MLKSKLPFKKKLHHYPVPEFVWEEYSLDQEINDRGITIDLDVVNNAIALDEVSKAELSAEMKNCTALENPNSVLQLKNWLAKNGMVTDTLGKKAVTSLLKDAPPEIKKVLELRLQLSKSSVKKIHGHAGHFMY